MTTNLIDKLADKIGIEVVETPVGFKYIGDVMVNNPDKFMIGGEESGSFTIKGHVPEKDGMLACLLIAEAVAMNKKSVIELLKDIKKLTGEVLTSRLNFHLDHKSINTFRATLRTKAFNNIAGMKIQRNASLDGHKFILSDNTWIGFRFSGTAPVLRVYVESDSRAKLKKLLKVEKEFVYGK
jgi:phosphomannomutase